ncbi:hypothetical protein B1C81_36840 [Streptomyces sp. HG99]|nr:hypothetical protein B1C81_36840 [Streptomyces sp. HG99]
MLDTLDTLDKDAIRDELARTQDATAALIEERTLDQAGRDGIILLHDIYDGTVPAVPGIRAAHDAGVASMSRGYGDTSCPRKIPEHASAVAANKQVLFVVRRPSAEAQSVRSAVRSV